MPTDTDGIYDLCKCGERASIDRRGWHDKVYQASCASCGYATRWGNNADVMTEWNKYQRGIKKGGA